MATVLILCCPQDTHAHAMCEALERKGATPRVFYTADFPERAGLTIIPARQGATVALHDPLRVDLGSDCTSVWVRRTFFAKTPAEFDESDRMAIERECRQMRAGFLALLCPDAFWVNPLRGHETSKATQLVAALRSGFEIPPTVMSNDPAEILSFVRAAPGLVIYKTFSALVPTTALTPELLSEPELLRWTPGIYQHYVGKDYELRVTVIGRRLFAVRINSQETARGRIDWREAQRQPRGGYSDLALAPAVLPPSVAARCLDLMQSLGLVFGAIDLIVTPQGDYVFLEVNPAGQFLWIDFAVGLPLLDATAEMLIQGRLDYEWNPQSPGLRYDADFERAVEARVKSAMAEHISDLRR